MSCSPDNHEMNIINQFCFFAINFVWCIICCENSTYSFRKYSLQINVLTRVHYLFSAQRYKKTTKVPFFSQFFTYFAGKLAFICNKLMILSNKTASPIEGTRLFCCEEGWRTNRTDSHHDQRDAIACGRARQSNKGAAQSAKGRCSTAKEPVRSAKRFCKTAESFCKLQRGFVAMQRSALLFQYDDAKIQQIFVGK